MEREKTIISPCWDFGECTLVVIVFLFAVRLKNKKTCSAYGEYCVMILEG
jgi:hypothetical protein